MPKPDPPTSMPTIEERIKEMMPKLTEEVAAQIRTEALRKLEYTVSEAIATEVKTYVAEFLLPHIKNELLARDTVIRAALLAGVSEMAEQLALKITEQAKKKIAGYDGEQLIKELMNKVFGRGY